MNQQWEYAVVPTPTERDKGFVLCLVHSHPPYAVKQEITSAVLSFLMEREELILLLSPGVELQSMGVDVKILRSGAAISVGDFLLGSVRHDFVTELIGVEVVKNKHHYFFTENLAYALYEYCFQSKFQDSFAGQEGEVSRLLSAFKNKMEGASSFMLVVNIPDEIIDLSTSNVQPIPREEFEKLLATGLFKQTQ